MENTRYRKTTPARSVQTRSRPWLSRAFGVLVGCGVIAVFINLLLESRPIWTLLWQRMSRGDIGPPAVAALFSMLAVMLLASVWTMTLIPLRNYNRRLLPSYFRVWIYTYICRYVPGKILLIAERIRLGAGLGISAESSMRALIAETFFLLLGGLFVLAAVALLATEPISGVLNVLLIVVVLSMLIWLLPELIGSARRLPIDFVARRAERFSSGRLPFCWQIGLSTVCALAWLAFFGSFSAMLLWIAQPVSVEWATAAFWFVAAYLAGNLIAIVPAGVGVREGILAGGLSSILPAEEAATLALAVRAVSLIAEGVLLMIVLLMPNISDGRAQE